MFTELFKRILSTANSSLEYLDISNNSVIDNNDDIHEAIIQELIEIQVSKTKINLKKLIVSPRGEQIKTIYGSLIC